jgi:hypothetical protein
LETFVLCPFRVGTLLWEALPGQLSLTVIVKATFLLVPGGEAVPAPEQDSIGDDQHWEESALGSLFRPDDLAPMKRRVDLALVGHAYAPKGERVAELTARLRVGDFFKTLEIKGDRLWMEGPEGLVAGAPIPFERMPLRYERAPLGPDNPVGVDEGAPPTLGAPALANLERADGPRPAPIVATTRSSAPASRSSFPSVPPPAIAVGFGPIAPTWRPRRKLLDEAGLFWAYGVASASSGLGPAPAGFNFEFFNTSPRDQQIDMLRASAVIELENLSPAHPRLTTQLPAIRPQVFRIDPKSGRAEEIILRCDTLWIDTDRGVAVLTFRGLYDVGAGSEDTLGKLVVAADPQGKKLRFDRVEQMLREQHPRSLGPVRPSSATASTNDPLALRYDTVKAARSAAPATPAPSPAAAPSSKVEPTQRFDWQSGFAPAEGPAPSHPHPHPEEHHDRTRDISQMPRRKAPLPFQGQAPDSSREIADIVAFVSAPTVLAPKEIPLAPPAPAPAPATPPPPIVAVTPAPPPIVAITAANTMPTPELEPPMTLRGIAPPAAVPIPVPASLPPELATKTLPFGLDGLAGAMRAESSAPAKAPAPAAPAAPAAPPVSTARSRAAATEPDPAPESVPIELYAILSAALARKGVDRGAVLRAHKLSIAGWGAIDRHWKRSLAEQTDRGDKSLLHAFDIAYVTAQSELHRPVGVREYARILIGLERGEVSRVLADLELQLSDLMRLQRVWSKRVADNEELAAELSVILEELRAG